MAKFVLHSDDGTTEEYPFDPGTLLNTEAMLLEEVTSKPLGEIYEAFLRRSMLGINVMFWLAKRRAGDEVGYADLTFDVAKLEFIEEEQPVARPTRAPAATGARKRASSKRR